MRVKRAWRGVVCTRVCVCVCVCVCVVCRCGTSAGWCCVGLQFDWRSTRRSRRRAACRRRATAPSTTSPGTRSSTRPPTDPASTSFSTTPPAYTLPPTAVRLRHLSTVFATRRRCARTLLIHDSLGTPQSPSETAARLVQPFLHGRCLGLVRTNRPES